jgi:hypothetical protein
MMRESEGNQERLDWLVRKRPEESRTFSDIVIGSNP